MKITLYLPFYDYSSINKEVGDDYYEGENSYIEALKQEYESTKDSVFEAMLNGNLTVNDDAAIGLYQTKSVDKKDNIKYSNCQCVLIGEDNMEETVDSMITHMVSKEIFVVEAVLDYDTIQEEFEGEINDWNNATNKINSYAEQAGEEWILKNLPKKDIKLSFLNKANKIVYMVLKNCQILERSSMNKIVFLVERAELIDNLY